MKHRLFVLTDITSLQAKVREPDDGQSLIRLLCYANRVEIEAICACSNLGHGQVCRPELVHQAIDAYAQDLPILSRHEADFPAAEQLHARVYAGTPFALPKLPVEESVGAGKETAASAALIEAVDRDEARPLWVSAWGGTADLAQALFTVRATRSQTALANFVAQIRVHACYDQDSTAQWIKSQFPELFTITRKHPIRGMYRGGDTSLVSANWGEENVKPCGALGALYPNYAGGDPWGRVNGIKEGDTPTYLNLISGDPLDGWGGKFVEVAPHRWDDAPVENPDSDDFEPRIATIYRQRPNFQADWKQRLDWL